MTQSIMGKDGKLLTSLDDIKKRWKEYIETLYNADEKPRVSPLEKEEDVPTNQKGPLFIKSEIEYSMKKL